VGVILGDKWKVGMYQCICKHLIVTPRIQTTTNDPFDLSINYSIN